jgi:mannose-6-phosphate isomerase-like protein (cupin superfamily)
MSGSWFEPTGKSGVFRVRPTEAPTDRGDPVTYPKQTTFDSHYHDCDEFWVVVDGAGTAVTEGRHFEVESGDCVATKMGDHHDFPLVRVPIVAVFFETSLHGQQRLGHLWDHTHGVVAARSALTADAASKD